MVYYTLTRYASIDVASIPKSIHYIMSPSAKRNTHVLETSSNFKSPNPPLGIEKKSGLRDFIETPQGKAITVGTSLLVLGGIAFAGYRVVDSTETLPDRPVATAPANPGSEKLETKPWYEQINTQPTANELIVSPTKVTPEQLPSVFVNDLTTKWFNAGYTKEFSQASLNNGFQEKVDEIAGSYDAMFIDSILVPDWESNPDLKSYVANMKSLHNHNLLVAGMTSFPNLDSGDIVPYMRGSRLLSVDQITKNSDGSITEITKEQNYDNADKNRVGEEPKLGVQSDNIPITVSRTYVVIDGEYRLADLHQL